jgi:hypothetical protein
LDGAVVVRNPNRPPELDFVNNGVARALKAKSNAEFHAEMDEVDKGLRELIEKVAALDLPKMPELYQVNMKTGECKYRPEGDAH